MSYTEGALPPPRAALGNDPFAEPDFTRPPTWPETAAAAFRLNNPVLSLIEALKWQQQLSEEPGYGPKDILDLLKGTADENNLRDYAFDRSRGETIYRLAQRESERRNAELLAASGAAGLAWGMAAGVFSPEAFLPAGAMYRAARGGYSASRTARSFAAGGAAQAAIAETVLQNTQERRDWNDGLLSVSSAAILAGLLGAGAAKFMTAAERVAATRMLDEARGIAAPAAAVDPATLPLVFKGRDQVRHMLWPEYAEEIDRTGTYQFKPKFDGGRYDAGGGDAGGDVLYLDADGKWVSGTMSGLSRLDNRVVAVDINANNMLVVTPENRARTLEYLGVKLGEGEDRYTDLVAAARAKGHDYVAIEGFDRHASAIEAELAKKYGVGAKEIGTRDLAALGVSEADQLRLADAVSDWQDQLIAIDPSAPKFAGDLGRLRDYKPDWPGVRFAGRATPIGAPEPARPSGAPAAVGAAPTDTRNLELEGFGLDKVPGLGWALSKTDPLMRTFSQKASITARRVMADLAETALRFKDNAEGVPTALGGPPVDRQVKMMQTAVRLGVGDEMEKQYSLYRFGAEDVKFARAKANVADWLGEGEDKLTPGEFSARVYDALHTGDDAIPQVKAAADYIKREVFDPIAEMAAKAKMFGEHVTKEDLLEHFAPIVYDRDEIARRRGEFVDRTAGWYLSEQDRQSALKARISELTDLLTKNRDRAAKIDAVLDRLAARETGLRGRLTERAMEAKRATRRKGVVDERAKLIAEEIEDLQATLDELRSIASDPASRERLADMEKELAVLRQAERRSRVSPTDLDKVEADVLRSERAQADRVLADETTRIAAEMVAGRRSMDPKVPRARSYFTKFGIRPDSVGADDLINTLGAERARRYFKEDGDTLDDIGEQLMQELGPDHVRFDPVDGTRVRPSIDEVVGMIAQADREPFPPWWRGMLPDKDQRLLEAAERAALLDDAMRRAGINDTNMEAVRRFIGGDNTVTPPATLADLDRALAEMEAAGQAVPVTVRLEGAETRLAVEKEGVKALRDQIGATLEKRRRAEVRGGKADARVDEARIALLASRNRLEILQDQMRLIERKRDLAVDMKGMLDDAHGRFRDQIEERLHEWKGDGANEALTAIRAREKYREAKTAEGKPPEGRLEAADAAVDRVIRRILESDKAVSPQELRARAEQTADQILGGPAGRLGYDWAEGGPVTGPPKNEVNPNPRGSFNRRNFNLPYDLRKDFLVRDLDRVMDAYVRTIIPDLMIAQRFGDVEMKAAFQRIRDDFTGARDQVRADFQKRIDAAPDEAAKAKLTHKLEKEMAKLQNAKDGVEEDIAAVRDRIRGVYAVPTTRLARNLARAAAVVKSFSVFQFLGNVVMNSASELSSPTMRYGFEKVMGDGWAPLARRLSGLGDEWKHNKTQLRAYGVGTEMELSMRHDSLNDLNRAHMDATAAERLWHRGAEISQIVNGQTLFTDMNKRIMGTVAAVDLLERAQKVAAGKAGKEDLAVLAENSIDPHMARAIWAEVEAGGGMKQGGVWLPNTADWKNAAARQAYEAAVAREADIAVTTPGQEKPLWMSLPVFGLAGLFNSFTAGAHHRMLIANLQRADFHTLAGITATVAMGTVAYALNRVIQGKPIESDPSELLKEGISRSGVLGWFEYANKQAAKLSGGRADIYRLIGAEKPLSRYESQNVLESLLGPAAGHVQSTARVIRAISTGEVSSGDVSAARRLVAPMQNHFLLGRGYDAMQRGVEDLLGVQRQ